MAGVNAASGGRPLNVGATDWRQSQRLAAGAPQGAFGRGCGTPPSPEAAR